MMEQNQVPQLKGSSGLLTVTGIRFVGGEVENYLLRGKLMRKYSGFRGAELYSVTMDRLVRMLAADGFEYQDHSLSYQYSSWVQPKTGLTALVFWTRVSV